MRAYGYSKNNSEMLVELSENTLECSLNEIEQLIFFLKKYKFKVERALKDDLWHGEKNVIIHEHLEKEKSNNDLEFIIATRINFDQSGDGSVCSDD